MIIMYVGIAENAIAETQGIVIVGPTANTNNAARMIGRPLEICITRKIAIGPLRNISIHIIDRLSIDREWFFKSHGVTSSSRVLIRPSVVA